MSEQPLNPEQMYEIPHGREGLSNVETAQARRGVADLFTAATETTAERQHRLNLEQVVMGTSETIALRTRRLESTIDLTDGRSQTSATLAQKFLNLLTGSSTSKLFARPTNERSLIQAESKVGSQIFGDVPAYDQREFFCLDKDTWVWYESKQDAQTGNQVQTTTRYEIHPEGILKAQEGTQYTYIDGVELSNLAQAIQVYVERISQDVYPEEAALLRKVSSRSRSDYTLAG